MCDDKLKAVMGGNAKVTMFNMNRFITDHLLEKLDKSAYVHDESQSTAPTSSSSKKKKSKKVEEDEEEDEE